MSSRRHVLCLLAATACSPRIALSQLRADNYRVGFLSGVGPSPATNGALEQAMRELGYVEGKNLTWERRFAEGQYDRLPALAAELVRAKVNVLVTAGTPAARAAQQATREIPIVTAGSGDPVQTGLVSSLSRPGANVTGITNFGVETGPKRIELLRNIVPHARRIGFFFNPDNPVYAASLREIERMASENHFESVPMPVRRPADIDQAFAGMKRDRIDGVIVGIDAFVTQQRRQFADLALANRIPSVGGIAEFVEAGGLAAYGVDLSAVYSQAAPYVDKLLKGAKPSELPVQQTSRFGLWVNQRTAAILKIKIPDAILLRADKVIE